MRDFSAASSWYTGIVFISSFFWSLRLRILMKRRKFLCVIFGVNGSNEVVCIYTLSGSELWIWCWRPDFLMKWEIGDSSITLSFLYKCAIVRVYFSGFSRQNTGFFRPTSSSLWLIIFFIKSVESFIYVSSYSVLLRIEWSSIRSFLNSDAIFILNSAEYN